VTELPSIGPAAGFVPPAFLLDLDGSPVEADPPASG